MILRKNYVDVFATYTALLYTVILGRKEAIIVWVVSLHTENSIKKMLHYNVNLILLLW